MINKPASVLAFFFGARCALGEREAAALSARASGSQPVYPDSLQWDPIAEQIDIPVFVLKGSVRKRS